MKHEGCQYTHLKINQQKQLWVFDKEIHLLSVASQLAEHNFAMTLLPKDYEFIWLREVKNGEADRPAKHRGKPGIPT